MANEFLYGAYADIGNSVVTASVQVSTVPVYIGTFPVNLIAGYADAKVINYPVKLSNFNQAAKTVGYSENWDAFTGCEAIAAQFDNAKGNVGPVYVINVLDPDKHKATEATTKTLAFANGRAEFISDTVILDTIALEEKTKDVDYKVSYNFDKGKVVITSLDDESPLTGNIVATYYDVDTTSIDEDTIIGESTEGAYTGVYALKLMYPELGVVPSLVAAPGWTDKPNVYKALIRATEKINGHWLSFVVADIPSDETTNTIAKAIAWKNENGYTNERSKVCWPKAADAYGRVYHLSTLNIVEYMRIDNEHNGVPMETSGNKTCGMAKQYFYDGYKGVGFDKEAANELCAKGISTLISWGGLVLWGDSTAAYTFESVNDIDARGIFDVYMRMLIHLVNGFQLRHLREIDGPMTLQLKDTIINAEQELLDSYVTQGALLGNPTIEFVETENPASEIMQGNFKWNIPVTVTPPFKSGTAEVCYTDTGLSAYLESEE